MANQPTDQAFEDALEAAYWTMDAMVKGYNEWKLRPKSERDAFKAVVRGLYAAVPEAQHTDDIAIDAFAAAMKAKMAKQRAKGYGGWDGTECPTERLQTMLVDHIPKGDPVDVGNFAMMLFNRGEKTASQQWKPIDTAPADGTVVDLWMAGPRNSGARRADCWFEHGKWWTDCGDRGDCGPEFYIGDVPTHWMPPPSPPVNEQTVGEQR